MGRWVGKEKFTTLPLPRWHEKGPIEFENESTALKWAKDMIPRWED